MKAVMFLNLKKKIDIVEKGRFAHASKARPICLLKNGGCKEFLFKVKKCCNNSVLYKMMATVVVEGDQKAPFSIANTPRCRRGCYFFLWIAPLYP